MTCYLPRSTILQNFSAIAQMVYEMCVTKVFLHLLTLGANPRAKVHQRGDDLLPNFHRPASTHDGDIDYKNPADKHTNTETVNNISPACYWHVGITSSSAGLKMPIHATVFGTQF